MYKGGERIKIEIFFDSFLCSKTESEEDNDEEDEFFDCDDTMNSNSNENAITKLHKPAGRLRKCGRLRLLNTGEPMYIPITQVSGLT